MLRTKNVMTDTDCSHETGTMFTFDDNDPRSIFSKPRARTHSALPDSIICLAKYRAVDPVEQLLLTL